MSYYRWEVYCCGRGRTISTGQTPGRRSLLYVIINTMQEVLDNMHTAIAVSDRKQVAEQLSSLTAEDLREVLDFAEFIRAKRQRYARRTPGKKLAPQNDPILKLIGKIRVKPSGLLSKGNGNPARRSSNKLKFQIPNKLK